MNLKPLLIIGFMQVLPFPIYPQEARETKKEVFSADTEQKTELVLHFRFDRSMVDYGYRDNNRILAATSIMATAMFEQWSAMRS